MSFSSWHWNDQVPTELRNADHDVDVRLIDKSSEGYVAPPPPAYVAYAGHGNTAGAAAVQEGAVVDIAAAAASGPPVVDESKPTTTIAVRLANGKRIKATLNLEHTIRDLQALIHAWVKPTVI
jgi:UBX domain-containing protein 1